MYKFHIKQLTNKVVRSIMILLPCAINKGVGKSWGLVLCYHKIWPIALSWVYSEIPAPYRIIFWLYLPSCFMANQRGMLYSTVYILIWAKLKFKKIVRQQTYWILQPASMMCLGDIWFPTRNTDPGL